MHRHLHTSQEAAAYLPLAELELGIRRWALAAETARKSPLTVANRERAGEHLLWFLRERGYEGCGEVELLEFFAYASTGHLQPGGRWGEADRPGRWGAGVTRARQPIKPSTLGWYHIQIRGLWNYLVRRGLVEASPMAQIDKPQIPDEQIQPFSREQVQALLAAAKRSLFPERDTAILLFLLDTGCRSSELLSLTIGDLDIRARCCRITGKGGKPRMLHYEAETLEALWPLLSPIRRGTPLPDDTPLFRAMCGKTVGKPLSREALAWIIKTLGKAAGIKGVRCSPHTLRHTSAVNFLRAGGSVFHLQRILGHSSLLTTQIYVKLAEADIAEAYKTASPVAYLLRRK